MTISICVNTKLLRMKSTAKQEIKSNCKKKSNIPEYVQTPGPGGFATVPSKQLP